MSTELPTMGVEEEFFLVDSEGRLTPDGPMIVADLQDADGNSVLEGEVQHELNLCQIESATGICQNPKEILHQLQESRLRFGAAAQAKGLRLLASGVPLLAEEKLPEITPKPRFQQMAEWFGATAENTASCGCHVHVEIPDRATGIAISDHLRSWLPALLAISANSPLWQSKDTSYASWRYQQWSHWPSAGSPPQFGSVDHYDSTVDAILNSGAALDRNMIYWHIRLSEAHPTIEFRIADVAATSEEATLLAVLIRGLVVTAMQEIDSGRKPTEVSTEILRAWLWRAARDGLAGQCPHPETGVLMPADLLLTELLDHITPVLKAGDGDYDFATGAIAHLREQGGGAQRQRAAFAQRNRVEDVISMLTRG